ncbi:MAG: hypothetical protein PVI54_01865 [Desulfobacteraceae bacterium]|jgi:hypothetical protein
MGKKSLIKSTTKKKTSAKEGEEKTTKKAAPKTTKKAAAKSTKKTASKSTKKATTKKTAPAKPKAAPKKTKTPKKVSVKELLFKKFAPFHAQPDPVVITPPAASDASAPALISSADPKEVERIRALLFNKFNMDDIKKAAKAPAPKAAEPVPEESPATQENGSAAVSAPAAPSPSDNTEPEAYITVESNTQTAGKEPVARPVKIGLAVAATIVFLLLAISYNNGSKYYLQPKDNAIEIWKGRFSPKDTQLLMVLPGTEMADPVKEVYTKKEVFPLIYNYYIEKADSLLEVPGLPNFEDIKGYLGQAQDFIVTSEMKSGVTLRLNNIERMILLYKADVSLSKSTEESIASAIKILKQAAKLTTSSTQAEMISKKIEIAKELAAKLKGEVQKGSLQKQIQ